MLESLQATNISRLNLDEPVRQPRNELDEILGRVTKDEWDEASLGNGWDLDLWFALKTIKPEMVNFIDNDWSILRNSLRQERDDKNWKDYASHAAFSKLLFPGKADELSLSPQAWSEMVEFLSKPNPFHPMTLETKLEMVYHMILLSPDRKEDLKVGKYEASFIEKLIQDRSLNPGMNPLFWDQAFRIIYPKSDKKLHFRPGVLNKDYQTLEDIRKSRRWGIFLRMAANLKILTADEVNLTEEGLEIIPRKTELNFNEEIPALPEVRKF